MKKYLIGLLIFISCIQILCGEGDKGLFDYVASRDEVAVLSMIKEDFDVFTQLGLQIHDNGTVYDEEGEECTIKVVREDGCTVGAIFYRLSLQYGSNYCEVKFLVVDELHQDKGYGSFMIKSIFNKMSELRGDGISMFGPLIQVSICRAFDEIFTVFDLGNFGMFEIPSPLYFAINIGDIEYVKALINQGCDPNELSCGSTPLMCAMRQRDKDIIIFLLETGADATINLDDESLLYVAISDIEDREIVKALIDAGADIHRTSPWGKSLLQCAMLSYDPELVMILLQAGCDPNHQDEYGDTPLHYAVENLCDAEIFQALLAAGADTTIINFADETPLDLVEDDLSYLQMKKYNSCKLTDEIAQLEKIKMILLEHQNKQQ